MKLHHIRSFVAVADCASFRAASAKLNVAQPALSRQIQELETDLGLDLLERSSKGTTLTPSGRKLYGRAKELLKKFDDIQTFAKQEREQSAQTLRIAVDQFIGHYRDFAEVIASSLQKLSREWPKVDPQLNEMDDVRQIDAILNGDLDAGFVYHPPSAVPTDERLARHVLRSDEVFLALCPSHPLAERSKISLSELRGEKALLWTPDASRPGYQHMTHLCREAGIEIKQKPWVQSTDLQMSIIAAGNAIGFMPKLVKHVEESVRLISVEGVELISDLSLYWRKDNRSPALKKLREVIGVP